MSNIWSNGSWSNCFGSDPDGRSFTLEKLSIDPISLAMSKLLPRDELVTLDGDYIVTMKVKDVHPLGMTASGDLSWEKNLYIQKKRRFKNHRAYFREVARFFTLGVHLVAHPASASDDQLIEITHQDGHKTFLVGIIRVDRMEVAK